MAKSIIKEIIIMLLLCIAIVLILGILFYDYIPNNKVIPTKEAYNTPDNVKEEINEQITELEKTEVSYEITDSDLNVYKQNSSYKPGKANPFALPEDEANTIGQGSHGSGSKNETGTSGNNRVDENKNNDSTGTFFNETK